MSDETTQQAAQAADVAAENAAPVTDTTAVSADSPVVGEEPAVNGKPETKPETKTFTQDDVDRIVAKEKAREARKAQRDIDQRIAEALQKHMPQQQSAPEAPAKPKPDQFATTEEYVGALARFEAEQIYQERMAKEAAERREAQQRERTQQIATTYQQRVRQATERYPDYEEVAHAPDVYFTNAMAATIQESEKGPDIAYFLAKNPAEFEKIAKLSPFLQAKELGKLEAKFESAPPPARPSNAPPPLNPIRNASAGTTYVDTTDPKSLEKMGTSAWIEAERKRQIEKWERQRR